MKKKIVFIAAMLLPAWLAIGQTAFSWMHDLEKARSIAAKKNAPLLVVFRCEP